MKNLTPTQRQQLKALAHGLEPVVLIGNAGLTPAVLKEIDVSLKAHELIKVKAAGAEREDRTAWLAQICETLQAQPVQHIGKILVIYREKPEQKATPAGGKPRTARSAGRGSAAERPSSDGRAPARAKPPTGAKPRSRAAPPTRAKSPARTRRDPRG